MPSIDVLAPPGITPENPPEEPQPPPAPVIGIIYPPPEVRSILLIKKKPQGYQKVDCISITYFYSNALPIDFVVKFEL